MKNEFSTKEVGEILRVTPQLMEDWISRGLIAPDLQAGAGAGSKRLFSRVGVYRVALAFFLKESLPRTTVKHLLNSCGRTSRGSLGTFPGVGKDLSDTPPNQTVPIDWENECLHILTNVGQEPMAVILPYPQREAMAKRSSAGGAYGTAETFINLADIKKNVDFWISELGMK